MPKKTYQILLSGYDQRLHGMGERLGEARSYLDCLVRQNMTIHAVSGEGSSKISLTGPESIMEAYIKGNLLGLVSFTVTGEEAERGWVKVHFERIGTLLH